MFDGHEAYRTPTDADYRAVLTTGLVVVDTNVLLNLYRYNLQARTDFLAVLRALRPNLWVPEQVIREFWKNREMVLRDPRGTLDTLKQLEELRWKAQLQVNQWAKLASLSGDEKAAMVSQLLAGFDSIQEAIEEHEDGQNERFAQDTNADPVLAELEQILEGRVGDNFTTEEYAAVFEKGKRRIEDEVPPGFADAKRKGIEGAVGDYVLWEQLLRHASVCRCDVVFVTAEEKPDWWRKDRSELRGPHRALVRELDDRAGVKLLMLQPDRLLEHTKAALKVSVSEGSAEFVARVGSSVAGQDDLPTGGWSAATMNELLARLDAEAPVQASAIRQAARQGGYISREDVFALGEYDPARQLKGFTRPVKRISQEFRDRGVIPEEAVDVFGAEYDDLARFGRASGFTLTEEVIPLLPPSP